MNLFCYDRVIERMSVIVHNHNMPIHAFEKSSSYKEGTKMQESTLGYFFDFKHLTVKTN